MRRPNILLIMTDTQATNMVGCYRGMALGTGHIDRLAGSGTMFGSAYTTAPVCTPARAGLFTGIYSDQSGAWTNNIALGANMRTMGAHFKAAGYRTAFIGKWHLDGHDYFGTGQCPPEWEDEYWYDGKRYIDTMTDAQISLWRNGLNSVDDLRKHGIGTEFTWAHGITERARKFIASAAEDDRPYLLVVSYDEPHHPFTCPPAYAERWADFAYPLGARARDTLAGKPQHQRLWAEAMPAPVDAEGLYRHPLYFACNDFVDDQIGAVIEAAGTDPWIVYTSDHGEMMGAHGLTSKGSAAYDDITRIPLIIRPPVADAIHRRIDTPVSHIDLLPTLLDIAGIEAPPILQGESLVPFLAGEDASHRDVLIEFNRYEIEHDSFGGFIPMRALVTDDFKLVINLFDSDELYDRRGDPDEMVNLIDAPQFAAIRNDLHDRLQHRLDEIRDPFRSYRWATRPWRPEATPRWMGPFRPKPADGVSPVVRDYDTGLPTKGAKMETKVLKY